jgi:hypothetical protein
MKRNRGKVQNELLAAVGAKVRIEPADVVRKVFRFVNPAERGSGLHSARKSVGFEDRDLDSPSV